MKLIAEPIDENTLGLCDCCGNTTKSAWGEVHDGNTTSCIYYIYWTEDKLGHYPNFDLIIGPWDEDSNPKERILVSLVCLTDRETRDFSVINSESRPASGSDLVGKSLNRVDVIGTKLAEQVFSIIDSIWSQDKRIEFMHY